MDKKGFCKGRIERKGSFSIISITYIPKDAVTPERVIIITGTVPTPHRAAIHYAQVV